MNIRYFKTNDQFFKWFNKNKDKIKIEKIKLKEKIIVYYLVIL